MRFALMNRVRWACVVAVVAGTLPVWSWAWAEQADPPTAAGAPVGSDDPPATFFDIEVPTGTGGDVGVKPAETLEAADSQSGEGREKGPAQTQPAEGASSEGSQGDAKSGVAEHGLGGESGEPVVAGPPGSTGDVLVVDNFDVGSTEGVYLQRTTTIGAYHGTFVSRPSYVLMSKSEVERVGEVGRSLVLRWNKSAGWCGYYSLLQDFYGRSADVRRFNTLSFMVKGEEGGERFDVGLADRQMQNRQISAFYVGDVNEFLPSPVSKQWQEARIPLALVEDSLDLAEMGSVVFFFRVPGKGKVYIDNLRFTNDGWSETWQESHFPKAQRLSGGHTRGLWVWKLDPMMKESAGKGLLKFCQRTGIERVYQYVGVLGAEDSEAVERYLRQCHAQGVQVHALNGAPGWALGRQQDEAQQWLARILEYNRSRPTEARFDGVMLDVEPCLLPQWQSDRATVKDQYLALLGRAREQVVAEEVAPVLGAVVAMAYRQEQESDPQFVADILKSTDALALMAYYDQPERIEKESRWLVDLAGEQGKKVWVTVETQNVTESRQGFPYNTFWEEGWKYLEDSLKWVDDQFAQDSGYGGVGIHTHQSYRRMAPGRQVATRPRPLASDPEAVRVTSRTMAGPVKVDGQLDEWRRFEGFPLQELKQAVYNPQAWKGPKDLSARFWSGHDTEYLYLAFDVTDDVVVQARSGKELWEGDHVEFWLDLDLMTDFNQSVNDGDDLQFGFSPGNFKTLRPEAYVFTPDLGDLSAGVIQVASARTAKGYTLEVAIPKVFLAECLKRYWQRRAETDPRIGVDPLLGRSRQQGGEVVAAQEASPEKLLQIGGDLGFSFEASDCDSPTAPQKTLLSSSVNRAWGDPTTFGYLGLR